MNRIRWAMMIVLMGLSASPAFAVYNDNISGVLTDVLVYADGDFILFRLSNQPSHPVCDPSFFAIDPNIPETRRNQLFARLLAAQASGEPVNIGYDNKGDCAVGYIRAHRVG